MRFEKKAYISVLYFSLISIIYSLITVEVADYFGINENDIGGFKFKNSIQEILVSLIIAPLLETIIFQYLVYKIIYLLKNFIQKFVLKNNHQYLVFYLSISSILFAINHSYSEYYILLMLLPGLILSFAFYYFKKGYSYPIFYVFLLHFFHNLAALIYDKF
ncbi:CPBP family glutamic-type intramembrane protease [Elizabethkingia anophelis]|uniref:CPBP family glutamic-type intramembrane protease n=1 Tax=Elizabethkingia anophelis TaxID=1117645 RepID=UPI0034618DE8|nr:CPBP family intramembrane metalloprotease [Elizabethkingia anophelis]